VWSAVFSPDGKRIVTASWDKTARLWDAVSGKPIGEPLRGHESVVNSAGVRRQDGAAVGRRERQADRRPQRT
jgi:WD40 repeat protein